MSEVGPTLDPPSPLHIDVLSVPTTPDPLPSGHDQTVMPDNTRHAAVPSPTDDGRVVQLPSPSYAVPERTTARHQEPPITPLSAAQPLSGNQAPAIPLLPQAMPENPPGESPLRRLTTRGRLLAFFGIGSGPELRERKEFMSLTWNLGFNAAQVSQTAVASGPFRKANRTKITAIIALLIYSSEHSSPVFPDVNEWRACSKPLGLWNSVWAAKVGLDCVILFWGYKRERASRTTNACVSPPNPPMALLELFATLGMLRPEPHLLVQTSIHPESCVSTLPCLPGERMKHQVVSPEPMLATTLAFPLLRYILGL
jgi:hypothetical protein